MWLARLYWLNFPNFPSVKKRISYVTACNYEKIVTASSMAGQMKKKKGAKLRRVDVFAR